MATTNPIITGVPEVSQRISKTITLDGTAGLGAQGAVPIFTVTGEVLIEKLVPTSVTTPVGATGTLALGVTGSTALLIAATTGTTITGGKFWVSTSPTANGIAVPAALKDIAITDNIIGTVATADLTAGAIRFDVIWRPLSPDGNLT